MKGVSGNEYAKQSNSDKYTGTKYEDLDCQGFVEQVLKDCGVRKPDGTVYNWKGSNSMWRNALLWKGTIKECEAVYGHIPLGAWLFIVKQDGGEVARGYHDSEGNATHVAILSREPSECRDCVRDSTRSTKRDGVGYRPLDSFTHVGLPYMIDYFDDPQTVTKEKVLEALEILTKFVKEC